MLAEFIDRISLLAREAASLQVIENKTLGVVILRHGNQVETHPMPPPLRGPVLEGLDDIAALIVDDTIAPRPEVYHDHEAVRVLLDRSKRTECARMPLRQSERFSYLARLAQQPHTSASRALVRWLHQNMPDAPQHVIEALRRLDFTRTSTGKAHVQHGRESLGNAVEAVVQGAENFPEEFTVRAPVYLNPGLREFSAAVKVRLWLDLDKGEIELSVHRDEIAVACQVAQAQLHVALASIAADLPVFYGAHA